MGRGGNSGNETADMRELREKLEHLTSEQERHLREKEDHHREKQKISSELQAERALFNEHLVSKRTMYDRVFETLEKNYLEDSPQRDFEKNQLQRNLKEAEKNIEDFKISISDLESKLSQSTRP